MIHDPSFTSAGAYQAYLSFQAAEAIRAEAEVAIQEHIAAAQTYMDHIDVVEPAPAPVNQRIPAKPLPGGGTLHVLSDGSFLREQTDGRLLFADPEGAFHTLVANGREVILPTGDVFVLPTGHGAGDGEEPWVFGLPANLQPEDLGGQRYRFDLPEGMVLHVARKECRVLLVNPGGTVLVLEQDRIQGIGEEVTIRLIQDGGRAFETQTSHHQGTLAADGLLTFALATGLEFSLHCIHAASGKTNIYQCNPNGMPV